MKGILYGIMLLLLLGAVYAADSATLSSAVLTGKWGESPSTTVTLTNTGNTTLNATMAIAISSGTWTASVNPTNIVNLLPGTNRVITVNSNIPSTHALGVFYGTITATYTGDGTQSATSTASMSVNPEVNAPSFTATSNIDFGSDTQVRGGTLTGNIVLYNNGNTALTLSMTSTLPSNYETSFGQASVTLQPGQSQTVPVTIKVPLSQNSGKSTLSGVFTATATNVAGLSKTTTVTLTTQNNIVVDKVTMDYGINSDTETISDGETVDDSDIKPGSSISLTIKARNTFTSAQGFEIRDVSVDVSSSGDLDLDDSDDLDDLEDGDKDEVTFTATIPDDAEDGDNYDVDVRVDGTDENGARHSDTLTFTIEISKDSHFVEIKNIKVTPTVISCNGGKVNVDVDVENSGRNNEKKAAVRIEVDGTEILQTQYNIEIDEDDDYTKKFTFNMPASAEGEYSIFVTTFYDSSKESDSETATFNVKCATSGTTGNTNTGSNTGSTSGTTGNTNTGSNTGSTNTPTPGTAPVVPADNTPSVGTASFQDSPAYIAVLAGGVLIVLVIIVALVVKLF